MWALQQGQDTQAQAGIWMQAGAADHLQGYGNQNCSERSGSEGWVLGLNKVKKVAEQRRQEICCMRYD